MMPGAISKSKSIAVYLWGELPLQYFCKLENKIKG